MKKRSIAFCVLTYNHPEVIQEVVGKNADLFQKYGIDIYIYDSSEGDETGDIIKDFIQKGYENIYYIRLASTINVDEKSVLILSGYGLKYQYDYLWPVKDRVYFPEKTIQAVVGAAGYGYNAIFLTRKPYRWEIKQAECSKEVYDDPLLFFRDWSWLATSLETTLMHFDSILKDVDWEKFKEKKFVDRKCAFIHYISLFTGLAKVDKPTVKILKGQDSVSYSSSLAGSSWREEIFMVWAYLWPKAVNSLPDCYNNYKKQAIKEETALPYLFGSHQCLMKYKQMGILTHEKFERYRDQWGDFSDISTEDMDLILEDKFYEIQKKVINEFQDLLSEHNYEQAYILFWRNDWIKQLIGEHNYYILKNCFQIYDQELDLGINAGIFHGVYKIEQAIKKYQDFKYFLRRVEFGIAKHTQYEFFSAALRHGLTDNFISYAIQRECIHEDGIANVITSFVDRYLTENGV